MRTVMMLIFLLIAGTSFAEDPLESLNTVEDTLSAMEQALDSQGSDGRYGEADENIAGVGGTQEGKRPVPEPASSPTDR